MTKFSEALEAGNFVAGQVCVDCFMTIASGETPDHAPDWDALEYARACAEFSVTLGHLHSGEWSTCYHAGSPCEDDCDCERSDFSRVACSLCASTLAGIREDVTLVRWEAL